MRQGQDLSARFPGIVIIHQKIRGKVVGDHAHEEHELFLPLQGEIQIGASGRTLKAGPGKMIYLPAGQTHSFQSATSAQGERLILLVDQKIWKMNQCGSFPASVVSASQLCKELLFHLLIYPKTRAARSLIDTLLQTASEMLEAAGTGAFGDLAHLEGRASDPRVQRALAEIQSRYVSKLSMENLARISGLSVRNLNRLFLAELGMTPKQIITSYRMECAKELLKRGRTSVTDIALEVGYSSVSQFITTFRKLTGQLPSEF